VVLCGPGQNARLTFSGSAGQRVSVGLTTSPQSACVAWPLAIRKPDDTTLVSVSACGTTFMEPATLPTSGTYTVLVDPGGATVPTSATVTLYDVAPDFTGSLTINGSAVAVPLLDPGQNGTLTFTATAGQQVTVRMTGNTIASVKVRLFRPDGSFQTEITSVRAAHDASFTSNVNGATALVARTANGRYNVVVQGSNGKYMTSFRNIDQKTLNRMAKKYEWEGYEPE
jgi:hypothetical protein